jgi:uncharacterized C2H2 Zn-finger protein
MHHRDTKEGLGLANTVVATGGWLSKEESLMAQRYSQRTKHEKADPAADPAHPVVVAAPRAIVRAPDGTSTWVARCPRCSDHEDESVVTGSEGTVRAECPTCGAIVEVRESGIYAASSPTIPPPKE